MGGWVGDFRQGGGVGTWETTAGALPSAGRARLAPFPVAVPPVPARPSLTWAGAQSAPPRARWRPQTSWCPARAASCTGAGWRRLRGWGGRAGRRAGVWVGGWVGGCDSCRRRAWAVPSHARSRRHQSRARAAGAAAAKQPPTVRSSRQPQRARHAPGRKPSALASYWPRTRPMNSDIRLLREWVGWMNWLDWRREQGC